MIAWLQSRLNGAVSDRERQAVTKQFWDFVAFAKAFRELQASLLPIAHSV